MSDRPTSDGGRFDAFRALLSRRGTPGNRLLDDLARARLGSSSDSAEWSPAVATPLGLPAAASLGPATFYADLAAPQGRRHVRVCTGAACFAATGGRRSTPWSGHWASTPAKSPPTGPSPFKPYGVSGTATRLLPRLTASWPVPAPGWRTS